MRNHFLHRLSFIPNKFMVFNKTDRFDKIINSLFDFDDVMDFKKFLKVVKFVVIKSLKAES